MSHRKLQHCFLFRRFCNLTDKLTEELKHWTEINDLFDLFILSFNLNGYFLEYSGLINNEFAYNRY